MTTTKWHQRWRTRWTERWSSLVFRAMLVSSLMLIIYLFTSLLEKQNSSLNPNLIRDRLVSSGLVFETGHWKVRLQQCTHSDKSTRACADVNETPVPIRFPVRNQLEAVIASVPAQSDPPNFAIAEYDLAKEEREWIARKKVVVLLLPRSVQNSVRLKIDGTSVDAHGLGADAAFSIPARTLLESPKITLEFDYDGFPWFGPSELPVALVEPDATAEYSSLIHKQVSAGGLSRQMEIGFPLLLAAMAIVLDHSRAFAYLSLYAGARALRSYVPFLFESGALNDTGMWSPKALSIALENVGHVANGLTFAFLLMFVAEVAGIQRVRAWWRWSLVLASLILFPAGQFVDNAYFLKFDLWGDFLGSLAGMGIALCAVCFAVRDRRKAEKDGAKGPGDKDAAFENTLSFALVVVRTILVLSALGISGWANSSDLFKVAQETFKNPLDWKHQFLLPALVVAALLELGSTAKKMVVFGKEMAAKALIEQELSVGKEVQQKMLPKKRFESTLWRWRSFYKPATALAGDWYDVRELKFSDGRMLLAACVADVTGHGVGSSLATSVICSHWGLWCREIVARECPPDAQAREQLLVHAPARIHDGLLALRENEQCTGGFLLIDPVLKEITVCSGGHPGILVSNDTDVRYLTCPGERLGVDLGTRPTWRAKTESLSEQEIVAIYSDGLVPPQSTLSSWANALRRRCKKEPARLDMLLLSQVRSNRKEFRKQHEFEDDMTLVTLQLNAVDESSGELPAA